MSDAAPDADEPGGDEMPGGVGGDQPPVPGATSGAALATDGPVDRPTVSETETETEAVDRPEIDSDATAVDAANSVDTADTDSRTASATASATATDREPDPAVDDSLRLLVGAVDTLGAEVAASRAEHTASRDEIKNSLAELVRLNRRADDHVAELHSENQRLRAGELASVTSPMLRDLVRLHDEVEQLATAAVPEAHADLDLVRSRLLDTLARWGLTPFAPEPGETVDATRHNGVGTVASSDGQPGRIATVRRRGFTHDDGRVMRPADIEVFRAPPPPEVPATTPATSPEPAVPETASTEAPSPEPTSPESENPTPDSPISSED